MSNSAPPGYRLTRGIDGSDVGDVAAPMRVIIVGAASAVAQVGVMVNLTRPRPVILGCLVPESRAGDAAKADAPIRVLGDFMQLADILSAQQADLVLLSLPVAMEDQARRMVRVIEQQGIAWRWLPTIADQLAGRVAPPFPSAEYGRRGASRPAPAVDLADVIDTVQLLGRSPRPLDEAAIRRVITDKTVMITGAGGSIGSELARIVARFEPRCLVLADRSENSLFEIDRQIATLWPGLPRIARLADVTQAGKTLTLLKELQPDVIFHAAAHKHVPMMEDHPAEAIENNFFGTRSIADAAVAVGAERFVMISTDKAVNPSSIMGASKRLAEFYVQHMNEVSDTTFSIVRFGNVLGSACSVLPIWSRQLKDGGPITVTDPRMTRYFMTIPEAAGLVLQSAAFAGVESAGGELFLLDMGKPVHILDLARRFIRAHGLEPEADIPIRITGVRPGEKLHEELVYDSEDMLLTPHDAIRILRTQPPSEARMASIIATFDNLRHGPAGYAWQHTNRDVLLSALQQAIPEMHPAAVRRAAAG